MDRRVPTPDAPLIADEDDTVLLDELTRLVELQADLDARVNQYLVALDNRSASLRRIGDAMGGLHHSTVDGRIDYLFSKSGGTRVPRRRGGGRAKGETQ